MQISKSKSEPNNIVDACDSEIEGTTVHIGHFIISDVMEFT